MWSARVAIGLHKKVSLRQTWASSIVRNLHTSVNQCRMWTDYIVRSLHTLVCRCQTWISIIVCILHISICRCRMWLANIFCRQHTSFCSCRPTTWSICQGLNVFGVACAHLVRNVCQWHATSVKAYTHGRGMCISRKWRQLMACDINQNLHEWLWDVHIFHATSAYLMQH